MKSLTFLLLSICPALAGESSKSGLPIEAIASPSSTGWSIGSISAGAAWRSFGSLDYRGSSRSQNLLIPSQVGGDSLILPAIGSADGLANRTYNNGYVNQDGATAASGDTWFWGYDSGDQIQGNSLVFNGTGMRSTFSEGNTFNGNFNGDTRLDGFSPQVDIILQPPSTMRLPFDGVLLSFWHFSDSSAQNYSNFSANQNRDDFRVDITDRFDIGGLALVPSAPYAGGLAGPGPLITNRPLERDMADVLIGNETATFTNSISTSFDLDSLSLAVGPTKTGSFSPHWRWQASAGLTLNIFKWSARQSETLNLSLNGASTTSFRT